MAKFWGALKDMCFTQQPSAQLKDNSPRMATLAKEVMAENMEEAKDFVYYDALKRVTEASKVENRSHTTANGWNLASTDKTSSEVLHRDSTKQTKDEDSSEKDARKTEDIYQRDTTILLSCAFWKLWFYRVYNLAAGWSDFLLDPEGDFYYTWTGAMTIAVFYNFWTIILRIAFAEVRNEPIFRMIYRPMDVLSDVMYVADMGIQFRKAYRDDHGIMISDPTKMAVNYCSNPYFIADMLSIFPLETVLSLLLGLQSAIFCRCPRLLKWHCVLRFFVVSDLRTSKPNRLRAFKLTLYLGVALHWVACGYYMMSEYEGLGSNNWVYPAAKGEDGKLLRKYIKSLYWSILTLTTIGETPEPSTNLEHVFTSFMFLLGIFVFAAVVGNVGDVISSMNAARTVFQTKMDFIKLYMEHHKVPQDLQDRTKRWAYYAWSRTHALDEGDSLGMLPLRLRAEIAIHVHLKTLKKVKIFKDCDEGLLCELVLKLRPQIFSPGDYICRCREIGREMYIINHGKVEVVVPDATTGEEVVVASLSEGNYFGEISLLKLDEGRNRRSADVRSVGYSELLCLSQKDLMEALEEYPDAKKVLESQGRDRLQRTKSEGNLKIPRCESLNGREVLGIHFAREIKQIRDSVEELRRDNKVESQRQVVKLESQCTFFKLQADVLRTKLVEAQTRICDLENGYPAVKKSHDTSHGLVAADHQSLKPSSTKNTNTRGSPDKRCKNPADRLLRRVLKAAKAASEANRTRSPRSYSPHRPEALSKKVESSEEELTAINDTSGNADDNNDGDDERGSNEWTPKGNYRRTVYFTPEITVDDDIDGRFQLLPQRRYSVSLPIQKKYKHLAND